MCTEIDSDIKLKILQLQVVVPIQSLLLKTWTWSFLRRLGHFKATKRVWRWSGKQGKYQGTSLWQIAQRNLQEVDFIVFLCVFCNIHTHIDSLWYSHFFQEGRVDFEWKYAEKLPNYFWANILWEESVICEWGWLTTCDQLMQVRQILKNRGTGFSSLRHCLEPQCWRMDLFPSFSRRLSLWSPSCWVLVCHDRHAKSSVQALSFGLDFFTRRFTWTCIKLRHEHYYYRELGGRAGQTDWRSFKSPFFDFVENQGMWFTVLITMSIYS
jgi:hypothetical protein